MEQTKEEKELQREQQKRLDAIRNQIKSLNDADKQRITTYLSYLACIVLAVLTSTLNLIFDVDNFDAKTYAISVCFNIVFGVVSLVLALKDGRLSNQTRRKGELYDTREEFKEQSRQIVDDDSFSQWNDQYYEKQKLEYIKAELSAVNINDLDYLEVSDKEFEQLQTEDIEFKEKPLDKLNELQYEVVKKFREGKYTFKKLNYSFFKRNGIENEYKRYADSEGKDKKIEFVAYLYRIAMIVIIPAILTLASISPVKSNGASVAYTMVSRIMNVCTSIFLGYSLAHDEATREILTLSYKISVIKQYLVDLAVGIFVPKSRTEEQMKKLEEIRKKREPVKTEEKEETVEIYMTQEQYDEYLKQQEEEKTAE